MNTAPDIVIIGSGIGGATIAAGLAPSGATITILEAGKHLQAQPEHEDQRAIFQRQYFKPQEHWYEENGQSFRPGNYYNVGGNSKFFGAVMARYRREDFDEMEHLGGLSPAWPISYDDLEPWYTQAEYLYQVRGAHTQDPTEPAHSRPYRHVAIPDEPCIAEVRQRFAASGLRPYSLPLGVDIDTWRSKRSTPWDGHPHANEGKMDAETAALAMALAFENVTLITNARVTLLRADRGEGRINEVEYVHGERAVKLKPKLVILSAGAVQSAALLLRSADAQHQTGLANSSGLVGRNFMNHNASAVIGFSPAYRNTSIFQKSFGLNDFYLGDGHDGPPLGNIQLLGRVSGSILKASLPYVPKTLLDAFSQHCIDFYAMSEDLPCLENRVSVDGDRITLTWKRNNWETHQRLVSRFKAVLKDAGFPVVLTRPFDKRTPSHQCGTAKMGIDPSNAVLDTYCRSYDHHNLFIVDASFMPTSAAVNPSLTIAAQALRVADHINRTELSCKLNEPAVGSSA